VTLLSVQNIETYYDLIYALRGVSLTIEEGTITAVLGTNGAGKTTILKTIMGLIDDQPDKGTITFDGMRIDGRDTQKIVRMGLSYVPEGREVFDELSVHENLRMGAYIRRDRRGVQDDLHRMYALFPALSERRDHLAGKLSGGEQQMLAIGRALMNRPKLLFLDEPSLGLSPRLVSEIFQIVSNIRADGVTILLVEQNARMALDVSDYAYVLENGRFVVSGTPAELKEDEDVREFYLGLKSHESMKGYARYKRRRRWA
jgi:branched-chain amino acid transport system ATP-binding protein